MRLNNYLIETTNTLDAYIPKIKKDCKPWLTIIRSNPYGIFRGMKAGNKIVKKKVRKDRIPLDTPQEEHETVDNAFKDKFGWTPRSSGLFVTPDPMRASAYAHNAGDGYLIFPIGKVSYLFSTEISDLYFRLKNLRYKWKDADITDVQNKTPERNILNATKEQLEEFITSKYQDNNINKAFATGTEIMINTNQYYAVSSMLPLEWLEQHGTQFPQYLSKVRHNREWYKEFIATVLLK